MKVAILGTRGVPARYGGFETFAEELGARLAAAGVHVSVYGELEADTPQHDAYRGIEIVRLRTPRLGPLSSIYFDMRCLWHVKGRFEVVYMLGYSASFFCFLPRLFGSQVWINMDGVEWERTKWSWIGKTYIKFVAAMAMHTANRIIADADEMAGVLKRRFRHVPGCVTIAYGADCVDEAPGPALLAEWNLGAEEYYLVVCRLEPENHVKEIIEGFLASASRRVLVVVGDHRTGTSYVGLLRRHAGESRVRFIGPVYDKRKLEALRYHCFAYFHGHSVGGTNPSLLEAMACRNAVIAHDNAFNREVAGPSAVYFGSARDIPGLCARLETTDELRESLRGAGQDRVRERYSWSRIADQYLDLLGWRSKLTR